MGVSGHNEWPVFGGGLTKKCVAAKGVKQPDEKKRNEPNGIQDQDF